MNGLVNTRVDETIGVDSITYVEKYLGLEKNIY